MISHKDIANIANHLIKRKKQKTTKKKRKTYSLLGIKQTIGNKPVILSANKRGQQLDTFKTKRYAKLRELKINDSSL